MRPIPLGDHEVRCRPPPAGFAKSNAAANEATTWPGACRSPRKMETEVPYLTGAPPGHDLWAPRRSTDLESQRLDEQDRQIDNLSNRRQPRRAGDRSASRAGTGNCADPVPPQAEQPVVGAAVFADDRFWAALNRLADARPRGT